MLQKIRVLISVNFCAIYEAQSAEARFTKNIRKNPLSLHKFFLSLSLVIKLRFLK